jgi:hypothetical protein
MASHVDLSFGTTFRRQNKNREFPYTLKDSSCKARDH